MLLMAGKVLCHFPTINEKDDTMMSICLILATIFFAVVFLYFSVDTVDTPRKMHWAWWKKRKANDKSRLTLLRWPTTRSSVASDESSRVKLGRVV